MARALLTALAIVVLAAGAAGAARADAGGKEGETLRRLFPEADAFEPRDVIVTDAMAARIEKLARAKVKDRLVTFYTARRGGRVEGYAVIHSHVVRTKRETLALVFAPDATIRRIEVLAFLEPPEYRPPDRWLAQLQGKGAGDRLQVGADVAPITGSTLSARGVAEESRLLLHTLREAVGAAPGAAAGGRP